MLRSMYSGISGLKNFQTKLDVIGNNIANVNTHGFKKGRVIFKDLYSQTVAGASSATATRGGVNAKQVGLGAQLGAIDTIHAGGSTQFTGNTLDLAIEGDGFFIVADGTTNRTAPGNPTSTDFSNPLYTRAGNFYMDNDGFLVNADGKYLVGVGKNDHEDFEKTTINKTPNPGWQVKVDDQTGKMSGAGGVIGGYTLQPMRIPTNAQTMSIGNNGLVTYVDAAGTLKIAGQMIMAKFPNPGGLQKTGANYFQPTANSGAAYTATATEQGMGTVQSGSLEMSNVDLGEEFTEMIVAQRGFQANTRIITTSDEILQELVNLKR